MSLLGAIAYYGYKASGLNFLRMDIVRAGDAISRLYPRCQRCSRKVAKLADPTREGTRCVYGYYRQDAHRA